MNKIAPKQKRLPKEIRKIMVSYNVTERDAAFMLKNLLFNHSRDELIALIERNDIPIVVQVFAHSFVDDLKKGNNSKLGSAMEWAFAKDPDKPQEDINNLSEEDIDLEIQKLLDQK